MFFCNVDSSIVIIGDLNFPSIDRSNSKLVAENERCTTLFSIFSKQHCFEQLVGESTYLSPSGNSSLLDVILCNNPFNISDVTVSTPFSVSDHCAVNFKFHGSTRSTILPAHELRDFLMLIGTVFVNSYHTVIGILYSVTVLLVKILYLYVMLKLNETIASFVPLKVFKPTTSPHQFSHP